MSFFADSTKAKHAAKVGLAMVIAYGLALQWNWTNPYWAGMAVTFCSLTTTGESLNKSALRIWGTLLGTFMAFVILALFIQDRWLFMCAVCVHLAIVTYLMTGTKAKYLWQVTGFVSLIIMSGASGDSNDIFLLGMARMQETLLGCIVWALVTIFVWPVTNQGALENTANRLTAVQRQLFNACRQTCLSANENDSSNDDFAKLRTELIGLLAKLDAELIAAGAESYAVRELRLTWRGFLVDSRLFLTALDNLHVGVDELQTFDIRQAIPNIDEVFGGIDKLLAGAESSDQQADSVLSTVVTAPELDKQYLLTLSYFDRAAVSVLQARLKELSVVCCSLLSAVSALRGDGNHAADQGSGRVRDKPVSPLFVLDPDRLRSSVYIIAVTVLGFLLWVYFDPPGHQSLWSMAPTIGFIAAMMPHVRVSEPLLKALAIYLPIGASFYILVMPVLSGYFQLSVLIFLYVFWVQYKLKNFLAVVAGMLGLLNMMPITNMQSYSFVGVATGYLFILLCMVVVISCAYILGSARPEKVFIRLARRYFRSASFILEFMARPRASAPGMLASRRLAFHRQEIATLPQKMQLWGAQINRQHFPQTDPEKVAALVAGLDGLRYRLQELVDLREQSQAAYLVTELSAEVKEWREVLQRGFELIVNGDSPGSAAELIQKLSNRLGRLETHLSKSIASDEGQQLTAIELEHAYRLLGAYRGVANAAVAWVEIAEGVSWSAWREECFS